MIIEAIKDVVEGKNISSDQAAEVMGEIMSGKATDAQIAALITALRIKGETTDEIFGFAKAMRQFAVPVKVKHPQLVDTCGTGGDLSGTFNISTTAAFVVTGAGVKVAKHGNRSVSSKSGSADVLEALGVNLNLSPKQLSECIDETGIAFLFAPALHPAMKYAIGPRREIAIRTIFNILGPLTNPARAAHQLMGVYDGSLTEKLAEVLGKLGSKHVLVVHGEDGLDEISITGKTKISELKEGDIRTYSIYPDEFGLTISNINEIKGGEANENAKILQDILNGENGPKRDAVLLNAAGALLAADKVPNFAEGIALAANSIDSGAALNSLNCLIDFTNKANK